MNNVVMNQVADMYFYTKDIKVKYNNKLRVIDIIEIIENKSYELEDKGFNIFRRFD